MNKTANTRQDLLTADILPLLIRTAIPTMIGMMIMMIYNLTDTFWIGRLNDKSMTAAIGLVYANTGVVLSIAGGILLMLVPLLFLDPLTRLLGADVSPALFSYTRTYLRIMLFAVPFSIFSTTVYNQLRLCGSIKAAMTGMMTGILANIVLDPLFILGFKMGIAGAGIATLIGQAGSCIALIRISSRGGNVPVGIHRCSRSQI